MNPVILLYKKSLTEVHEYLADQGAIFRFGNEKYESFLMEQISQQKRNLTNNFYSLFKQRIKMIHTDSKTKIWQYVLILPMLVIVLSLFSFTYYPVYQFEKQENKLSNFNISRAR